MARQLAELGHLVQVIDQRPHIAGNCFDEDIDGVRVHRYGPHIFHTNNQKVFDWLSRFTEWVPYRHRVKALHGDRFLTMPPNLETQAILGDRLIDVLYRPYTKKMWGTEVDQSVLDRVRPRSDHNELYFPQDRYQYLPRGGYTALFGNMLDHAHIRISLNTQFDRRMEAGFDHVFFSGAIDQYYDYQFGDLPYRSLRFYHTKNITHDMPTPVVNYTDDGKFTRVTSWRHFPEHGHGELYTLEEPLDYKHNGSERYYPVRDRDGHNRMLYQRYRDIGNPRVCFIGRCGLYVYLDMDMACSSAMNTVQTWVKYR